MSGPVFRDYNWNDLLRRVDPDMDKPVTAYQFGNGAKFLDSGRNGGAYTYSHKHVWKFNTGLAQGWSNPSASASVDSDSLNLVTTGDASRLLVSGLDFDGSVDRYVRMRFRQTVSGTWQGRLYYSTAAHGFTAGYYKDIPDPGVSSGWVTATWDMHALTAGGDDWADNTITGLAFALITDPTQSGTAQAGSSNTITLAAGSSAVDDAYKYMLAQLKSGSGSVQERTITAYNGTSKVATVSPRWRTNLIHRSEQFDLWTLAGASVSSDTDYGVDGALSADTITDASAVAFGNVNLTSTVPLPSYDQTVVAKFWIKKDAIGRATRFVDVRVNFLGGTTRLIRVKLDTGTGEYSAPATASTVQEFIGVQLLPTALGDFWVVTIIGHSTDVANNASGLQIYPAAGSGAAFTDNAATTGSAVFSRAQLEYASSEGDYIATTASAITPPDATTAYDIGSGFEIDWIGLGASSQLDDENLPVT